MFKKEEKAQNQKDAASIENIEQKNSAPAPSLDKKAEKTIIGEHISIDGNIRGGEDLVIEGAMKGKIDMDKHNFALGAKGRFEGEIQAHNVSISGQMVGNIKTQGKVEISKEADFSGEIKAKSISVGDGAYFKGTIELDREPHRKQAFAEKSSIISVPNSVGEPSLQTTKPANKAV